MNLITVIAVLAGCFVVSHGYNISALIPVQRVTPGIRYMPYDPRPQVTLEVFISLHCGASRDQWPIIKQVLSTFGNDKLDVIVQQFPQPYFRNAFLATQGLYVIQDNSSAALQTFNYIERSMELSSNFSTANTFDLSEAEVLEMIADVAESTTGIDRSEFISKIGNYREQTIANFKFAVKRGVAVTPTYFLNGVELTIGKQSTSSSPTFEDWIEFLNPLFNL